MLSIKQKAAHTAALILFAIVFLFATFSHPLNLESAQSDIPASTLACSGGGGSEGLGGGC